MTRAGFICARHSWTFCSWWYPSLGRGIQDKTFAITALLNAAQILIHLIHKIQFNYVYFTGYYGIVPELSFHQGWGRHVNVFGVLSAMTSATTWLSSYGITPNCITVEYISCGHLKYMPLVYPRGADSGFSDKRLGLTKGIGFLTNWKKSFRIHLVTIIYHDNVITKTHKSGSTKPQELSLDLCSYIYCDFLAWTTCVGSYVIVHHSNHAQVSVYVIKMASCVLDRTDDLLHLNTVEPQWTSNLWTMEICSRHG